MRRTTDAAPRRPRILLTTEASRRRDVFFPAAIRAALEAVGEVEYHDGPLPMTATELASRLHGVDVCVTHWGCPRFTPEVLAGADRLGLIAHAGGSVGDLVTTEVFERGITVTTANSAMAAHVAEGVLAYVLADLQRIVERARLMQAGGWLDAADRPTRSLADLTIGLIGLGAVGDRFVELLKPFRPRVLVYDPYRSTEGIESRFVEATGLEDLLRRSDVVSLHAALTPESRGLLDARRLSLLRDGALLVNTARAGLIDAEALNDLLSTGRVRAVLDVFEVEPLPADSPLRQLPGVTPMPHTAGSPGSTGSTALAVEEVVRFAAGRSPAHPVSLERFRRMTQETTPYPEPRPRQTTLHQEGR